MLHLELPHVNVLSKVDLLAAYGRLDFGLDFYTEVFGFVGGGAWACWGRAALCCGAHTHAHAHTHARTHTTLAPPPTTHTTKQVQDLSYLVHAMGRGAWGARYRCVVWRALSSCRHAKGLEGGGRARERARGCPGARARTLGFGLARRRLALS